MALACYCSFVGFDCFYNVLICKSLWIKVSAKLLNKYLDKILAFKVELNKITTPALTLES